MQRKRENLNPTKSVWQGVCEVSSQVLRLYVSLITSINTIKKYIKVYFFCLGYSVDATSGSKYDEYINTVYEVSVEED